jgi:hypothetical protein
VTCVLANNYAQDDNDLMRRASNRMCLRLIEGLSERVAVRFVYSTEAIPLQDRLQNAWNARDWVLVAKLATELVQHIA